MTTIKQPSTLKPKRHRAPRRTAAEIKELELQIYNVLFQDHPLSIRHVFYRMTNPRLPEPVEKTDRGYRQVQQRCTVMRRNGSIPYNWFADLSRHGYFTNTYSNAAEFLESKLMQYRADLWFDADWRCEVWAESRSIASVILDDCIEMAVDLFPCGGFPSMTFVHEAAMAHNSLNDNRPLMVFYIGDYDPAGVLIDRSLETELREHLNQNIPLYFNRLAITPLQIATYDLPSKPRKRGDKRVPEMLHTVEAEAMPARVLRKLLRKEIENLLPHGALRVAKVVEQSERAHLGRMVELLHGAGS